MNTISCGPPAVPAQWLGLCLLALLVTGATMPARASDIRVHGRLAGVPSLDAGTTFDLHFDREDLAVEYDDGSAGGDLRLRRLGISIHEALSSSTRLGIRLGWAAMTQSGRPSTAGLDPSGYFVGLEFASTWPRRSRIGLDVGASWRYTAVAETELDGDRTELDWQSFELRPAVRVRLARGIAARLGASAVAVDGDERRSADNSTTTPFSADGATGAFVALDVAWPDGGAITLRARGGNPVGMHVSFEQRY